MTMLDSHIVAGLVLAALEQGDTPPLDVVSGSMTPLFRVGDKAIVEPFPVTTLKQDDIIVVCAPDMLVTHRFCEMYKDNEGMWLILRGDRRMGYDEPVHVRDYIGRVSARQRGRTYLSLTEGKGFWLSHHYGRIARFEAWLFRATPDQARYAASKTDLLIGQTWHHHWHSRQLIHAVRLVLYLWGALIGRFIH